MSDVNPEQLKADKNHSDPALPPEIRQALPPQAQALIQELEQSQKALTEQNLELQQLNESKEAMMYMMVHDMKTPLTVIMGALILSQNPRFDLHPDLKGLLKDSHIQSIKLRAMIDDILTISRMRSREFQLETVPADLITMAQQSIIMMNMVKGDRKLTLKLISTHSSMLVQIDYQLVERVINNVLSNAIKYAPEGSELLVEIDTQDGFARVSITNFGEAIPLETHKKIFEMFGRAKPKDKRVEGTGLGLAFCKTAVEAHHGKIWVLSPIPPSNFGARFYFTLPLAPEAADQAVENPG